jgi:AcrR family transcriptional regulator
VAGRLSATDRREQLLRVALTTFARAGYHETSMNDVAEAAGVTKPVLYQHFQSKRDLYQALLEHVGGQMVSAFKLATDGIADGKEQTRRGFEAYFRWVAANRDAFRLLYGGGSRQDQEFARAVRRFTDASARAIAPLIAAGIDPEHQLTLAHAIVGMSEGASRRLVERGDDFDPDVVADQLSTMAWAGLRSLRSTPAENLAAVSAD